MSACLLAHALANALSLVGSSAKTSNFANSLLNTPNTCCNALGSPNAIVHLERAPSSSRALASAAAVAAFAVGLQLTKQLRRAEAVEGHPQPMPSADAFLRAGVHQRLLFGAIEVGIVLVLLGAVEASPQRRADARARRGGVAEKPP